MVGILLLNLGTPDAATTPAVRKYLRQFLSDPRVIDINPIARQLLLNLIILPFRSSKSAEAYKKVWTPEGSPLLVHTKHLAQAISKKLNDDYAVTFGMRYGKPSIEAAMQTLIEEGVRSIRVLPLFPQYATSSYGSAAVEVFRVAKKFWNTPPIEILPPFFNHVGFLDSFAEIGKPILEKQQPDHVLFSFHGLPERHILKSDVSGSLCLHSNDCCIRGISQNPYCYRSQCFYTANVIAQKLGLTADQFTICFQSRLGRTPWIKPYTDLVIPELIAQGKKKLAVFCPSFVSDCLETLEEIGIRAKESALAAGATSLELIPSLNTHPTWVDAVCELVQTGGRQKPACSH